MAFLDEILDDTARAVTEAKRRDSIGDLKRRAHDTPPVRDFAASLSRGFGLIAEIKRKSPSAGNMREENVREAPSAYAKSQVVNAVSVLTNSRYFGMSIDDLLRVKNVVRQPILRKDFISTEYQIYQARAYGADAILLMVNVLQKKAKIQAFYDRVRELGMQALFEAHTKSEIDLIPEGAQIYGINSRRFMATKRWFVTKVMNKLGLWRSGQGPDPSIVSQTFSILVEHLPKHAIKVAESGVRPSAISELQDKLGYDAVLVGTSLLKSEQGIHHVLSEYEKAIHGRVPETASSLAHAAA
jgi:indole-3-glycerol phosphate synthase